MRDQRFILYTRPDGGVSVCAPSLTALRFMTNGGGRWDGFDAGFIDRQIEEQAKHGVGERAARQFVRAMQFGGCTDAEAYEIMRDRFCAPLGTACELVDSVSNDRWFRDAWRRSHNGGPIAIDMGKARKTQFRRIEAAARKHVVVLELARWRERIRRATSPEQLKQVWPRGLKYHHESTNSLGLADRVDDRSRWSGRQREIDQRLC